MAHPNEIEWFKKTYQGDSMKQLTLRATIMGALLGMFMSLSNLYVGLKTGWGLGVAITACILSFAIHKVLMKIFPKFFPTPMSILENNCMQSTASSAGYSTGGTMVSAISAYLIVTGAHMPWHILTLWTFFLAALGVFLAIPMKRQMINIEELRFPSGTAAAETLRSLHTEGAEAMQKAKALGISGALAAALAWFRDGAAITRFIPGSLHFPGTLQSFPLYQWTFSFEMSAIMIAAGAIMGWKIAWSMLAGAVINYGILAPKVASLGGIDTAKLGYRAIVSWSTWAGASMMVTSGLFVFATQWRTVFSAFSGIGELFGKKEDQNDPMVKIEVPTSWFLAGTIISGLGCMLILHFFFGTSYWMGFVAIVMTFFLALVACRATGESDITPIGAMGKITQLTFGILAPSNLTTNLMTAGLTAGAAGSSADLLTDLKSGYLLGANPRQQFIAQFLGIFAGCLIVIPAFYILVPEASSLGGDLWPAPSAQVWAAVAKLLSNGLDSLHPTAKSGLFYGALIGILLPVLEILFPKNTKYIPSATGLGLSMVIPFWNSFSMFLGASIALVLTKRNEKLAEKYIIPVSSGIIAGESLMGVVVALLSAGGVIS